MASNPLRVARCQLWSLASAVTAARSTTCGRLYFCDPLLKRLAQDLEDVTPELRECSEEEHAVVCPRHLCRQRHLTAADQPHLRNRMMGGATRLRGHKGRAPAGQAGNAMDARGFDGLGQRHLRQERREASRQPRCPRPRGTQQEDVGVRTPGSRLALEPHRGYCQDSWRRMVSVAVRFEPGAPVRSRWPEPRRLPAVPAQCLIVARCLELPRSGPPARGLRAAEPALAQV
jgi:hypothetical protein